LVQVVGFTGSLRAGRALFDAAASRPNPIPVHAEMGSINPLFLLPGAAAERGRLIAEGLRQSVTLGVGQFCTKPGVVVAIDDDSTHRFVATASELMQAAPPGAMLHSGISAGFVEGARRLAQTPGVRTTAAAGAGNTAVPTLFVTDARTFAKHEHLREELFGPATLVVISPDRDQMLDIARRLDGHLTATMHGTDDDLQSFHELVDVLQTKVGRLIFNGFPTGVEVSAAMHHGGPYPATTDSRFTSVGTAAIERWARPICYQNFPQSALPPELHDENPRRLWRLVDGTWTRGGL
jgi:NADP-dependent aldehyde dehydrogenase